MKKYSEPCSPLLMPLILVAPGLILPAEAANLIGEAVIIDADV